MTRVLLHTTFSHHASLQFDFTQPPTAVLRTRGHRFSVTSAVASESGKFMFTAGKEGSIIKWDLFTGKKVSTFYKVRPTADVKGKGKGKASSDAEIKGHTDEVLSLALSGDGKLLASAGKDRRLGVWDTEKAEWIKGFSGHFGHKDTISVCSFLSRPTVLALTAASSESCFSERNQSTLLQFL